MGCKCEHCHQEKIETQKENGKLEKILYIIAIIIFIVSFYIENNIIKIILYATTIGFCGYEVLVRGIENIFHLNFEKNTLVTIAVVAIFILGKFSASCFVLLVFRLVELIEERAIAISKKHVKLGGNSKNAEKVGRKYNID